MIDRHTECCGYGRNHIFDSFWYGRFPQISVAFDWFGIYHHCTLHSGTWCQLVRYVNEYHETQKFFLDLKRWITGIQEFKSIQYWDASYHLLPSSVHSFAFSFIGTILCSCDQCKVKLSEWLRFYFSYYLSLISICYYLLGQLVPSLLGSPENLE